jgi:hypothetical protein
MKIKAIIPAVVIVSTLAAPAFAQTNGPVLQGSQINANGAPVAQAAQTPQSLTHRDVYNLLVQASSLNRFFTSVPWNGLYTVTVPNSGAGQ